MGKATQPRKARKQPGALRDDVTPERANHNEFGSAGMARSVVPPILALFRRGDLTEGEYVALHYYGQQATLAQAPSTRDSCDFSVRGGEGFGPSLAIQSAKKETSRLEGLLGALKGIAFAVCVEDKSLTRWAIDQHGARERVKGGKVIELVPRGKQGPLGVVDLARWDLKFAARRMMK